MRIRLTPLHSADLAPEFAYLIDHPPEQDVTIRTLARKLSNDRPLIQGELVLAGKPTRQRNERAREYPVHFRKTYFPGAFHPPATREFELHEEAAALIDGYPPIGATSNSFRSCYIPGIPLSRISPFGVEPLEQNVALAERCEVGRLLGLWRLLEETAQLLCRLHEGGMVHGDLFLHNVVVSKSPIGVHLIDFAQAQRREDGQDDWTGRCRSDFAELCRHALWTQCGLGGQSGFLGEISREGASEWLGDSARHCLGKIEAQGTLHAVSSDAPR